MRAAPFAALVAALASAGFGAAAGASPRAVVELFTSQGCSSCPPADRLLAEYAAAPDIVALSYPVRIWDHLGWRDTLATEANTRRQLAYAETRGDRQVYTPQVVVNGVYHVVGSDRAAIETKRSRSLAQPSRALSVPVTLTRDGARLFVHVAAWPEGAPPPARLLVLTFEHEHTVQIERGENRGRSMTYRNVVRGIDDRGPWSGAPQTIEIAAPEGPGLGVAVLLQTTARTNGFGVVLGAARTP